MTGVTRFGIEDVARAVLAIGESQAASPSINLLFEAYGLDVLQVEAILSRVSPEHLSKLQAMAIGVVIGVCLAEQGPAPEGGARR